MTASNANSPQSWDDDDLPEWNDDQFSRAQFSIGGKIIRATNGTLTKAGRPISADPKHQVTLRIDSDVLSAYRATGKGWQSRINAELRKALGL